ncbi:transcriptional regulator, TetR family [Jatrophihabitans endophyticus]|uniref:Transcriptional regulator, TetR family n=1 Tax=Jatrophihabitans endophyticus TaxID=1206085 RepID=A0A1M5PY68_9ACTN|nr:TetR/AcrR family transcriptional regulator [Jatrophihabitans endophyticus]SHH06602.1 transcriptional regulator, TetR family [Jatrophihabitans endophyticus]
MPRTAQSSKSDILRTFAGSVANSGYDETSFREIAEELGISKGTIVHHYGTKERLLEAVHREYMDRRLREAEQILAATTGAAARLTALIAQLLVAQRDDRDATVTFAREIARFATMDLMADVRHMRSAYTKLVRGVLSDGVESGEFKDVDVDLVTLQIFGMCNWSWTWWGSRPQYSVVDVVEAWTTSLLSGLRTSRGPKKVDVASIVASVEAVVEQLDS